MINLQEIAGDYVRYDLLKENAFIAPCEFMTDAQKSTAGFGFIQHLSQ